MPDAEHDMDLRNKLKIAERALARRSLHMTQLAHEIRAPLHNVLSLCYAMKYVRDEIEQARLYEQMKQEVYRVKRMLDNLVSAHLDQPGGTRLAVRLVDLVALVRDSSRSFAARCAARGISIRFESKEKSLMVRADPEKISLVLSNLIDNAIRYSYPQRSVEIRAKRTAAGARLDVTNVGLGFFGDEIEGIFELYSSGGARDARREIAGSGLGLFVSREIVLAHGGSINIESCPIAASPANDPLQPHVVRVSVVLPADEADTDGRGT